MSDDQDGCEWVSVSSGTGLPGLSRTKGRLTFVCVCTEKSIPIIPQYSIPVNEASILARRAGLFSAVSVLPSALLNPPDHQFQQKKWHPISSRSPKLQQTRLSDVRYAIDGTRHVKTLQQILVLRQAKWSVLWANEIRNCPRI